MNPPVFRESVCSSSLWACLLGSRVLEACSLSGELGEPLSRFAQAALSHTARGSSSERSPCVNSPCFPETRSFCISHASGRHRHAPHYSSQKTEMMLLSRPLLLLATTRPEWQSGLAPGRWGGKWSGQRFVSCAEAHGPTKTAPPPPALTYSFGPAGRARDLTVPSTAPLCPLKF